MGGARIANNISKKDGEIDDYTYFSSVADDQWC